MTFRSTLAALLVGWLACASGTVHAGKFAHLGWFTDMRHTEEHSYGITLELLRDGDAIFGTIDLAYGLAGDTPTGLLQDVEYQPETGRLAFNAKLTTSLHYCSRHDNVPSREWLQFEGKLSKKAVSGTLREFDGLHPEQAPQIRPLRLLRTEALGSGEGVQSREQWDAQVREGIKRNGPEW